MSEHATREEITRLLSYDPESGVFRWASRAARSPAKVGDIAGHKNRLGYVHITVFGRAYAAHRLAWLMVHGKWPSMLIDHIDGNPSNNAIANLREASKVMNGQNQRRAQRHNSLGVMGVTKRKGNHKKPYQAMIRVDGKARYLGVFATADEAHGAYIEAKRQHQPGCTI